MWKKIGGALLLLCLSMNAALADIKIDVNKADQAALDGIKGIGPTKSKAILAERKKNGAFKNWDDLTARVKGIGEKSAAKLSEAGLTVNGQSIEQKVDAASATAKASASVNSKPNEKVSAKVSAQASAKASASTK